MKNKFETKFPKQLRKELSAEIKKLFKFKNEKLIFEITVKAPITVEYGWDEGACAQYFFNGEVQACSKFDNELHRAVASEMKPKLAAFNKDIKTFYKKLDKLAVKYKTDADDEFNSIIDEFKLMGKK